MICVNPACGRSFTPKRQDARTCSPRCRKAVSRYQRPALDSDVTHPPYPTASPCDVKYNRPETAADVAPGNVFPLGRLPGDTIPDRRWRFVRAEVVMTLECQAMVPGGWKAIATKPTLLELGRVAAWAVLILNL